MSSRFSAGLGKLQTIGGKGSLPLAEAPLEATPPAPKKFDQPNRRGKVVISAYFDPAVRKQLAIMAVEMEATQAALMAEALNLLFERHGRSPIARA